jgi:hypothetical protein
MSASGVGVGKRRDGSTVAVANGRVEVARTSAVSRNTRGPIRKEE